MLVSTVLLAGFAVLAAASSFSKIIQKEYPKFSFRITSEGTCSPTLSDKSLALDFKRERIVGTVGRIFSKDSLFQFTFQSPPDDFCEEIVVTSPDKEALQNFRDDLITRKVEWLRSRKELKGVVVHPDEIRISKAYGVGSIGQLGLKGLRSTFESFSKDWEKRLGKRRRGRCIFRFTDDSPVAMRLSRGDLALIRDPSKSSVIQVVGGPSFPQSRFESLHKMHPSAFAMIPAAAMAIRVMDMEEIENLKNRNLVEVIDWSYAFVSASTPGIIQLNKRDIEEGALEDIKRSLSRKSRISYWADMPISYQANADDERLLDAVSNQSRLFDIVFTTGFVFGDDCPEELLEKNAGLLTALVRLQYDAIIMHTLSKVPDMESVHLYPLLPMAGKLAGMNLKALSQSIQRLTRYHPDIVVYFHVMTPVTELPNDTAWQEALEVIRESMRVRRYLFMKGSSEDEISYIVEREGRQRKK